MGKFQDFFSSFTQIIVLFSSNNNNNINIFIIFHMLFVSTTLIVASKPPLTIPFSRGFDPLFGGGNIIPSSDDLSVRLHLNEYTGSGFRSSDYYNEALFSAKIKLPSEYTAGVVVAFYTTNEEIFKKTHDELDFEFLGNIKGKAWRFQTNMYGNGSTSRGREERYYLWFDPTFDFHTYSILWTNKNIIFSIDDIPIREIKHKESMGEDYPKKPMSLYATIWDASDWATSGGKYKVNYKYAPFVAEFTHFTLNGCVNHPLQLKLSRPDDCTENTIIGTTKVITSKQRAAMKMFRLKYMYYSYCYDTVRYPIALPECVIDPIEKRRFKETGRVKFDKFGRRRSKRSKSSRFGSGVILVNEEDFE